MVSTIKRGGSRAGLFTPAFIDTVREQANAPAVAARRRLRAGDANQLGFPAAIELAFRSPLPLSGRERPDRPVFAGPLSPAFEAPRVRGSASSSRPPRRRRRRSSPGRVPPGRPRASPGPFEPSGPRRVWRPLRVPPAHRLSNGAHISLRHRQTLLGWPNTTQDPKIRRCRCTGRERSVQSRTSRSALSSAVLPALFSPTITYTPERNSIAAARRQRKFLMSIG